jgi:antitoxin component YwqK of YwqJK toxin-antitoxin module
MKITIKDLENKEVCFDRKKWFIDNFGEDVEVDIEDLKSELIKQKEYTYLRWLYVNFKLSGEYLELYDNGNVKVKVLLKNGKFNGDGFEYDKDGNIFKQYSFKNGTLDGVSIEYYNNGSVFKKLCFENNILNGDYIEYFKNGKLKFVKNYTNGVETKIISIGYLNKKKAGKKLINWFTKNISEYLEFEINFLNLKDILIEQKKYTYLKWLYKNLKLSGEFCVILDNKNAFNKYCYINGKLDCMLKVS